MFKFLVAFKILLLTAIMATSLQAQATDPIKTVYHLSEGNPQAVRAIQNIRFHLAADPKAKIVVVALGSGVDFLLDGATSQPGQSFAGAIGDLASMGVEFRVCQNTLEMRAIDFGKVAMEATLVRSGVAEIARLQAREGFTYLDP